MDEAVPRVTAVSGVRLADAGGTAVRVAPAAPRSLLNLRGRPENADLLSTVRALLGVVLPDTPNRWNGDQERAALWLGPDEWLLMVQDGEAADLEAGLRDALGDDPWLSVVDLSHNYTGFNLTGPASREVLGKGCPLDLHPRFFGPGDCAQTLLARAQVLLRAVEESGRIEVWVRNSFACHIAEWLMDAMAEFQD